MKEFLIGQFIPGDSFIHHLDARIKLFSFLLFAAAVILADNIICFTLSALFLLLIILLTHLPFALFYASIKRLVWFLLLIFLMNMFFFAQGEIFWQAGIFSISAGGIRQGANIVLRVIFIIAAGNVLSFTTTPLSFTSALESLLRPLKILKIPTEEIAMILSVAFQFIPVLAEEAENIKKAQIARGAVFGGKGLKNKAASVMPMLIPVFVAAFRRADELAAAMEARGYKNAALRTQKEKEPIKKKDFLVLVSCFIFLAIIIFLR